VNKWSFEDIKEHLKYFDSREDAYKNALDECYAELEWALEDAPEALFILDLYLYDHSGITMNTTGFSCGWDSGQVGIIYVSKEKALKEWPLQENETEEEWEKRIYKYLDGEVKNYDAYLTGDVWGYIVTDNLDDEVVESCWGFYGHEYCEEEAQLMAKHYRETTPEQMEMSL
jgi:hypothetical protein